MRVVGPFTDEPGYELLYWLPYLRGLDLVDTVAITRGGAGVWYRCRTLDAYDLLGFDCYTNLLAKRGRIKSNGHGDLLDEAILDVVGMTSDLRPSSRPWGGSNLCYERLPRPERLLDGDYTAVRLYRNQNLETGSAILRALEMAEHPLVVLKPDRQIDDHAEMDGGATEITYAPRGSLVTISRIVAHAKQFICTAGGLSYLGPLYGVPTIAVCDDVPVSSHLAQEDRMIEQCGADYRRVGCH